MKYCRLKLDNQNHYGLIESVAGTDQITRLFLSAPQDSNGDLEDVPTRRMDHLSLADAMLLPPVSPTKIVCVGRNYREHATELGNEVPTEPLIFFKPPSSLLSPGGQVRRPKVSGRVDFEGELGVVIAKRCHKLAPGEDVRTFVLGYTCVNDVTARDLQKRDGQFTRAKGFDTFCPVGPLVTNEIDPWAGIGVETKVNGTIHQQGNTRDFIFPLDAVIRYISEVMTLLPGDLIPTGTPQGVGPVVAGDTMEVTVEGVGTLTNAVIDE
jgi:2-keto-4-pentenoate hydratase/2-oxohepta-3-ene-1,7-dioic acid hydratase in catechol pathway